MVNNHDSESQYGNWATERAFLHALSTPLSTLGLELEVLTEALHNAKSENEAQESAKQLRKVLDRVFRMIQARREQIPPTSK